MNHAHQLTTPIHCESSNNAAIGITPEVFTSIYDEHINLVALERTLDDAVASFSQLLINAKPHFNLRTAVNPDDVCSLLESSLPELANRSAFIEDLALLVQMYAYLFDLDEVGIRLQVLDRAMCPRFHVDKLGCRLVSTYKGAGTEWLYNHQLDRSKLGAGNMGLSDDQSGLYPHAASIQQVSAGDVVLLKGEGWHENEGYGVVHRSPTIANNEQRLVVTLDFA